MSETNLDELDLCPHGDIDCECETSITDSDDEIEEELCSHGVLRCLCEETDCESDIEDEVTDD